MIKKSHFKPKDIRIIMKNLEMNQTQIAEALGISRQTVWGYLNGFAVPLQIEKHLKLLDSINKLIPKT
jgi:transcriptional regulator with XRE-family HTH domain